MGKKFYSTLHRYVCILALVAGMLSPFFTMEVKAVCSTPTDLSVTNLSATTATLTWDVTASAQHVYDIIVSSTEIATGNLAAVNATTPGVVVYQSALNLTSFSYPLTGLSAGTHYYAYLRQDCSWDYQGYSDWVRYEFYTPCLATSVLPVSADFDGGVSIPSCWSTSGVAPIVQSAPYSGTGNAVKMNATGDKGGFLYSPVFSGTAQAYYLTAKVCGTAGTHFSIGVAAASDLNDISGIYTGIITESNVWQTIDYAVPAELHDVLTSLEYVLVFQNAATDNAKPYYIDEVVISTLPTCLSPIGLEVSNIGETSVTLAWTERANATTWNIEVANGENSTIINANTNPFVLNNLLANTAYSFRVKTICGASDESAWSEWIHAKTSCSLMELPYSEDFNSYAGNTNMSSRPATAEIPDCWDWEGDDKLFCMIGSSATYAFEQKGLFFSGSNTAIVDYAYAILPSLNANNEATQMFLKYKYESLTAGGDLVIGYLTTANDPSTFVVVETLPRVSDFTDFELFFPAMAVLNPAIRYAKPSTSYYYAGIDNIIIRQAPTCLKPTGLTLNDYTKTTAKLTWTANGNESNWELTYQLNDEPLQTVQVANTPEYTITGLNAATDYTLSNLSVRAVCSESDRSDVLMVANITFATLCDLISLPYTQDFEMTTFPGACWTGSYHLEGTAGGWSRVTTASDVHTGAGAAKLADAQVNNRNVIATPFFHSDEPNSLRVSFWMKRVSGTKPIEGVRVWANTIANDTLGGTPLIHVARAYQYGGTGIMAPVETAVDWYNYVVTIPVAGDICLLFEGISEYGNYSLIDDITIEPVPTCDNQIRNMVFASDAESISMTWNTYGASQWELSYKLESDDKQIVLLTDSTYSISGLLDNTTYTLSELAIRAICAEGDTSVWTSFANQTLTTKCRPIALPFTEDFDFLTAEQGVPDCWDRSETTLTTASYNWNYYANGHTGNAIRFNSYSAASGQYSALKTPMFQVPSPRSVEVVFAYKNPTGGDFSVYVSRDGGKTYSEALATGLRNQTTWEEKSCVFSAVPSDKLCIVFKATSNYGTGDAYIYLDDVHVEAPLCGKVTGFNIQSLTKDAATISWMASGADTYDVALFDTIINTVNPTVAVRSLSAVSATSVSFSDLTPNHTYYAYVKGNCESENGEWSNVFSFRTECAEAVLPYLESFEDLNALLCWRNIGEPVVVSTVSTAFDGSKAASVVTDSVNVLLVSPRLDAVSLAAYEVNLAAYATAATTLTIGVVLDPTDVSTYVDLGTISLTAPRAWNEYRLSLAALATSDYADYADAKYLAISVPSNTTVYFDALSVAIPAGCAKPTALETAIDGENIRIDWSSDATDHFAEIKLGEEVIFQGNVAKPFVPANLESNTSYSVRVRAICDNDSSEWTPFLSFKTPCSFASLPFFEGFEDYTSTTFPDCWDKYVISGPGTTGFQVNTTAGASYIHTGSKSLKLNDMQATTHSLAILPMFNSPRENGLTLRFWMYRATGTTKNDEGVRVWVNNVPSLEGATALMHVTRCGGIAADSLKVDPITSAGWYQYEAISPLSGPTYVMFEGISEYGLASYYDDIEVIETPRCAKPVSVKATNIEQESAAIVFSDPDGHAWEYVVNDLSATPISLSVDSFVVTGLSAMTSYTVYVRRVCDVDNVSEWKSVSFKTACGLATRVEEGFEDCTTGSTGQRVPDCWTIMASTSTTYPYVSNSSAATGSNCLYMYSYSSSAASAMVALPQMQGNLNQYRLRFKAKATTAGTSPIFVVLSNTNDYDVMLEDTTTYDIFNNGNPVVPTSAYEEYTISFANYHGDARYVAFYFYQLGSSVYVDDVVLELLPSCDRPQTLTLTNVETSSAQIAISDVEDATAWEYVLNDVNATPVAVANDTFLIEGLSDATEYTVYVRRVCSSSETSEWKSLSFRTVCGAQNLPYNEDFNDYTDGTATSLTRPTNVVYPDCWTILNEAGSSSAYPQAFLTSSTTYAASGKAFFVKMSSSTPLVAVLPTINVPENANVSVSFCYRNEGTTTSNGHVQLGYVTNVSNAESFVLVNEYAQTTTITSVEANVVLPAGAQVAFRFAGGSANNYYAAIDNVEMLLASECERPQALSILNYTASSVDVLITDTVAAHDAWEIVLVAKDADPSLATPVLVNNKQVSVAGEFVSGSSYDVYVRTVCGANDYSSFRGPVSFKYTDYSTMSPAGASISSIGAYPWDIVTDAGVQKAQSTNPGVINTPSDMFVTITVPEGTEATLHYNYAVSSYSTASYGALYVYADEELPTTSNYKRQYLGASSTLNYLNEGQDYIKLYAGTHVVRFRYYKTLSTSYGDDHAQVWNLNVTNSSFFVPSDLHLTNLSSTEATLAWAGCADATSYQVRVRTAGSDTIFAVTDTHTSISGLSANTAVQSTIRACSPVDTTAWCSIFSFVTPCEVISLPYVEDFDSYTSAPTSSYTPTVTVLPDCWNVLGSGSYVTVMNSTTYANSGTKSLMFMGNTGVIAALPTFVADNLSVRFSLSYRTESATSTGNGTFEFGYLTIPGQASSFVSLQTGPLSTTHTPVTVIIPAAETVTPAIRYVAGTSTVYYAAVDNIAVDVIAACEKPERLDVLNVSASQVDLAIVDSDSDHNAWQVAFGAQGFDPSAADALIVDTDSKLLSITPTTPLVVDNYYDLYARTVCGENDFGPWTMVKTVKYIDLSTVSNVNLNLTEGAYPWVVVNDGGINKLQSTNQGVQSSTSDLTTTLVVGEGELGTLSFNYYASGEGSTTPVDYLCLYVDEPNPSTTNFQKNLGLNGCVGTTAGMSGTYSITLMPGTHTIRWRFYKDSSIDGPGDLGQVWNIRFASTSAWAPMNLVVQSTSANSAVIAWDQCANVVKNEVLVGAQTFETTADSIVLSGLTANTLYSLLVRSILANDTTDWSETLTFRTDCEALTLPYVEDFEEDFVGVTLPTTTTTPSADNVALPYCWSFVNNNVGVSTSTYPQAYITAQSTYVGSGEHALFFKNTSAETLLAILPEFAISETTVVRMDYSYRNESTYASNGHVELVRIDAAGEQTLLNSPDFTTAVTPVSVDNITLQPGDRLAFRYLVNSSASYYASVDDIRISRLVLADTIEDTTCSNYDYQGHGFQIAADQLTPGERIFTMVDYAETNLAADTLRTLKLTVNAPSVIEFHDTICANAHYTGYGFDIESANPLRTEPYVRQFTNAAGCDSTITLYLYVPDVVREYSATICEGESFLFGDTTIYTSGVYTRVATSPYECDSVITVRLTVQGTHAEIYDSICPGQSYFFNNELIYEPGVYTETTLRDGCDSVTTLYLSFAAPVLVKEEYDVCSNKVFNYPVAIPGLHDNLFSLTEAGVYRDTVQTADGCTEIIEVTLVVNPIEYDTVRGQVADGEPFVYGAQTYTKAGTYEQVLATEDGCDKFVTIILVAATGLENVQVYDLEIAPNPVNIGEEAVILTDLDLTDDYLVHVYDAVGKLVARSSAANGRIPALSAAGIYTVRITAGDKQYQSKLVVK